MAVDERRAAIVEAALPLLRENGAAVTTKEIALAAGVAEGTVFRVFESKDAVVSACIAQAFDTAAVIERLEAIDRTLPLELRLVAGVEVMKVHTEGIIGLMSVLHSTGQPFERSKPAGGPGPRRTSPEVDAAFHDLIGPDAHRFRYPVQRVITFLSMLTLASAHPMLPNDGATPADVVAVLLHGALTSESEND